MPERDVQLYLSDILDSCEAITEYVAALTFEEFCNDRKTYSAVIREFEIIGEAVGKLPEECDMIMLMTTTSRSINQPNVLLF